MADANADKKLLLKAMAANNVLMQQLLTIRSNLDNIIADAQQTQIALHNTSDIDVETLAPSYPGLWALMVGEMNVTDTNYQTAIRTYCSLVDGTVVGIKPILTIAELCEKSELYLLKVKNIGRRSLTYIKNQLGKHGLKLKDQL